MSVYVFDIDGTLANIMHRIGFVRNKPKNWPAFEAAIPDDEPVESIIDLFKLIVATGDHHVIISSGRSDDSREATEEWLHKHGVIGYDELLMRPTKNYEADYIIKTRMAEYIENTYGPIAVVFDDRNQVVDMWRDRGITCAQVAPGDF